MRNINFSLIILFLLFSLRSSFASSREIAISETLDKLEVVLLQEQSPSGDLSAQDVQQREYCEQEAMSDKNQFQKDNKKGNSVVGDDTDKARFYISGGLDNNYMHYSEWDGANKLDEDFGHQDGYYLALGYRSQNYYEVLKGKPFIEGYFRRFGDIIHYKGAVSNGITTWPSNMDARSQVTQFGVKLGGYADFTDQGEVLGYLDIGKRMWDRGEDEIIDNAQSEREMYKWVYTGFGVGINYRFLPKLSAGIDGEWLFTYQDSRRMHANVSDYTFKLGNIWGLEIKAPIKYLLFKNLSLDLTPYFTYWKIKESDPIDLGGGWYAEEPDSKTHIEGLLTGVTCYF